MDTSYKYSSVGQVARGAIGAGGFKLVREPKLCYMTHLVLKQELTK